MMSRFLDRCATLPVQEQRFLGVFAAIVLAQEVPSMIVRVPVLAGLCVALLEFCPRPEAKAVLQIIYKPLDWLK